MILESEEHQNCTSDCWSNGNDKEEPHKDPTNHLWERYHKQTAVGGCVGLSDDPEKSPRYKTLRTRKLHNFVHESRFFTETKVDTLAYTDVSFLIRGVLVKGVTWTYLPGFNFHSFQLVT